MFKLLLIIPLLFIELLNVHAQNPAEYIREHAIRIDKPDQLNDSVYSLLSPYQVTMVGEMHGTNESAAFVIGLANLFTGKGDSVQVGLEIAPEYLSKFLDERTDSSVYTSEFFANPPYEDGKETFAWASVLSTLNSNPKVKLFFFDTGTRDPKSTVERDSQMYFNVKKQFLQHPAWKMITLSGNFHNRIIPEGKMTMAAYLDEDRELNISNKICRLNQYYIRGSMINNSGNGLTLKTVDIGETIQSTAVPWDFYIMMANPMKNYPYDGIFFCRTITPAKMVNSK